VTSKLQGTSEAVVEAPAQRVWELLVDSETYLPQLWPMVKAARIDSGGRERVGALRRCDVVLDGKEGWTVERCLECVPGRRLAHTIESDSFGFSRFLRDFWFAFDLEAERADRTIVRVETHYEPGNLVGRLMSVVAMRRRFRGIRETALINLKRLSESPD
jgi:uncharacterized protein YndB with AHSA1/START domain